MKKPQGKIHQLIKDSIEYQLPDLVAEAIKELRVGFSVYIGLADDYRETCYISVLDGASAEDIAGSSLHKIITDWINDKKDSLVYDDRKWVSSRAKKIAKSLSTQSQRLLKWAETLDREENGRKQYRISTQK